MGRLLVALAREDARLRVAGAVEAAGHATIGRDAGEGAGGASLGVPVADALGPVCRAEQAVLDFTAPAATLAHAGVPADPRPGPVGERPRDEIGIMGLRAGDAVGDHTVVFGGLGERLELVHRAQSRDCLARGALRAALWVAGRPAGLYSMRDVLGL